MLEIKLPREIMKSPLAMETALGALLQSGGVSSKYDRLFKGQLPAYSSLEIASLEGVIHFYVRIQQKFQSLVESNFYAQYPGIEIMEADDYTKKIHYHHLTKEVSAWGADFTPLGKSWSPTNPETGKEYEVKDEKKGGMKKYTMPADFLPIKTYVDYELDKNPKEEFKTDPMTPLLEFMGSVGKGEYVWYQILIQDESVYDNRKMDKLYVNTETHEHVSLSDMADARKKQLRTASWAVKGKVSADEFGVPKMIDSYLKVGDEYIQQFDEITDKDGKTIKVPKKIQAKYLETKSAVKKDIDLTPEEKDELEAINRKLSKPLALTVVRLMYIAKNENFNGGSKKNNHIMHVLAHGKPYKGFNGFGLTPTDPYGFPWENFRQRRVPWRTEEKFEAYVEREGFFPHVGERTRLDKWEDQVFWTSTMKNRRIFRMIYEAIFYPFDHPLPSVVSTLNLEEIATLWHFPGTVAGTPTLPRIDSTKGVAPSNLPQ